MAKIYVTGSTRKIFGSGDFPGVTPELFAKLTSLGHSFTSFASSDAMISLNHHTFNFDHQYNKKGRDYPRFLIRIEPESVFPAQFLTRVTSRYVKVFTLGSSSRNFENFMNFPTAYRVNKNPLVPSLEDHIISDFIELNTKEGVYGEDNWRARPGNIVFIASNKASPSGGRNYFLRRKLVAGNFPHQFDVYGAGWNGKRSALVNTILRQILHSLRTGYIPRTIGMFNGVFSKFPDTNGFVADKHNLLKEYKFNVIIENSSLIHTEKIFDAFINGTIPIYFGPQISGYGVPDNAYLRFDGTMKGLNDSLNTLEDRDFRKMREESKNFVTSKEFQNQFSAESVYSQIADSINLYLQS
jgi:hypothetical protein